MAAARLLNVGNWKTRTRDVLESQLSADLLNDADHH